MKQHTPGPWYQLNGHISSEGGGEVVCSTKNVSPQDATLIAACPELLAALEKLVRVIGRMPANAADGIADEARAAIAKAKGELK